MQEYLHFFFWRARNFRGQACLTLNLEQILTFSYQKDMKIEKDDHILL